MCVCVCERERVCVCMCVETSYPLGYFSIWIMYANKHLFLSVPHPNTKVPYWIRRLHKNTFRGTRCSSARKVELTTGPGHIPLSLSLSLSPFVVRGDQLGSSARMVEHARLHGIEPATFRVPTHFCGDVLSGRLLSIGIRYGNNHMVVFVPYPNAKVAYRIRRLHSMCVHACVRVCVCVCLPRRHQ